MARLLFVCVHNAGRSVMAEAFARAAGADARSAGTVPQERPHPEVVDAMQEVGIDVSSHRGVLLSDELVEWADRVITMGCAVDADACPAIRYAGVEDWGLDDPKGRSRDEVRTVRDEIRERVDALVAAR
ncbi:MAG: low molecular weight phosphatase family protein [Actinomycetota bacterium]